MTCRAGLNIFGVAILFAYSSAIQAQTMEDLMPENQKRVIRVIYEHLARYKAAENELQKSTIATERAKAIRDALKGRPGEKPTGWVGAIEEMGTTGSSRAWVVIRISKIARVRTWNNEFSDSRDHTLIAQGSPVYKALSSLKPGDVVRFDCQIQHAGMGLTEAGRMLDPEFLARFKSITPIPGTRLK